MTTDPQPAIYVTGQGVHLYSRLYVLHTLSHLHTPSFHTCHTPPSTHTLHTLVLPLPTDGMGIPLHTCIAHHILLTLVFSLPYLSYQQQQPARITLLASPALSAPLRALFAAPLAARYQTLARCARPLNTGTARVCAPLLLSPRCASAPHIYIYMYINDDVGKHKSKEKPKHIS